MSLITVSNCKEKDEIQLRKLWKDIFKDTDEYIDIFFKYKFSCDNTFVIYEGEEVVSTIYAEDITFNYKGEKISGVYLCGILTKEDRRGKGYAKELISYAVNHFKDKKIIFLIPANQSLFSFYKQSGFRPFTYIDKVTVTEKEDKDIKFKEIFDKEKVSYYYNNSRDELYVERSSLMFDAIGECYKFLIFEDGYIAYYIEDNKAVIMEYSYSYEDVYEIAKWMNYKFSLGETTIYKKYGEEPFSVCITDLDVEKIDKKYINIMLN